MTPEALAAKVANMARGRREKAAMVPPLYRILRKIVGASEARRMMAEHIASRRNQTCSARE